MRITVGVLAMLVGFGFACGDDTPGRDTADTLGDGRDGDDGADADADADADTTADADAEADSSTDPGAALTGFWGQIMATAVLTRTGIPILGEQWSSSRAWQLVEITSDGAGNLTLIETPCLAKVKTGGVVRAVVEVPQTTIDRMPPIERHVALASSAPSTPFVSDVVYAVRGANLCDPQSDPLPTGPLDVNDSTSCDQPCGIYACDQDEDGHPGITTHMEAAGIVNCDVYAVARGWSRLDGQIADATSIAGTIADRGSEQEILAATQALCASASATISDDGCAAHTYFKMVRLDGGTTCADVLALTDCDEDPAACDANAVLPLDPNNDTQNGPECG